MNPSQSLPKRTVPGHAMRSGMRTKVASHDAMPGWAVFLVEFLLDEGRHVLLHVELV